MQEYGSLSCRPLMMFRKDSQSSYGSCTFLGRSVSRCFIACVTPRNGALPAIRVPDWFLLVCRKAADLMKIYPVSAYIAKFAFVLNKVFQLILLGFFVLIQGIQREFPLTGSPPKSLQWWELGWGWNQEPGDLNCHCCLPGSALAGSWSWEWTWAFGCGVECFHCWAEHLLPS